MRLDKPGSLWYNGPNKTRLLELAGHTDKTPPVRIKSHCKPNTQNILWRSFDN